MTISIEIYSLYSVYVITIMRKHPLLLSFRASFSYAVDTTLAKRLAQTSPNILISMLILLSGGTEIPAKHL